MPRRGGPKPKHLSLLRAADGIAEPDEDWTDGPAPCPFPLDERQQFAWDDLVSRLRTLGLLRSAFWMPMYSLACAVARLRWCEEEIAEVGLTVAAERGGEKKNPVCSTANELMTQIRTYSAELGLTPASFAKIGPKQGGKLTEMDRLIRGD